MKGKMIFKNIFGMTTIAITSSMFLNMSLAANTATVNVETANLRESASTDASIVRKVKLNDEVEILENAGEWSQVKIGESTGYVKTELINVKEEVVPEQAPAEQNVEAQEGTTEQNQEDNVTEEGESQDQQVEQTEEELQNEEQIAQEEEQSQKRYMIDNAKVRSIPLINATETIEIPKDQEVTIEESINGWASIESNGTTGWIREEKLKTEEQKKAEDEAAAAQKAAQEEAERAAAEAAKKAQEEADKNAPAIKKAYVQKEKINLRKEDTTNSEILKKVTKNTEVDVLAEVGNWSKCRVDGVVGYISTQYLGSKKVEEATSRGSSKSRTAVTAESKLNDVAANVPVSGNGSAVVAYAQQFIGVPYVYAGDDPSGFDCSGFTQYVFRHFGVSLPHSAAAQGSCGRAVSRENLAPGDIVLYSGHVAIYVGGGNVIHAPRPGKKVCIVPINQAGRGYQGARRLI